MCKWYVQFQTSACLFGSSFMCPYFTHSPTLHSWFCKASPLPSFHLHCSPCILSQRKWSYPALISRLSPTTFINLHDFLPAFSSLGRREDSPAKANPSTCAPNPKIFHRWLQPCSCAIIPSHSHICHFPLLHGFFPQAYVYEYVSPL